MVLVVLLVGMLCFFMMCLLFGDMVYCIVVGCYGYDMVIIEVVLVVCVELGLD